MKIDIDNLLSSIMETLDRISFVNSDDIPGIDLYMDQVTRFMDSHLKNTTRREEEDKILTKTMINNYAKNELLPPPEKKKYSREHVLVLVFIYYFKNVLSIGDIQNLLNPLTERYFGKDPDFSIKSIYDEVTQMGMEQIEDLKESIVKKYNRAGETFAEADEEEKEFLQTFAFICSLSFDIYIRKLMIEKIIDQYSDKHPYFTKAEKKKAAKKDAADLKAAEKRAAKEQAEKEKAIREKILKEKEERVGKM